MLVELQPHKIEQYFFLHIKLQELHLHIMYSAAQDYFFLPLQKLQENQ